MMRMHPRSAEGLRGLGDIRAYLAGWNGVAGMVSTRKDGMRNSGASRRLASSFQPVA